MFGTQFYPTPEELAKECLSPFIDKLTAFKSFRVLDPSAGSGSMLDAYLELLKIEVEAWNKESEERFQEYRKKTGKVPFHSSYRDVDREVGAARSLCFAIELDGDLQSVLLGKGYQVIDSDFLQHQTRNHFNLVAMNPPFQSGAKHLLHAWETLSFDNLVCILNAETIRNPYTFERQRLADIIKENGFSVEFKQSAFSNAERKTDVEIAIVKMSKQIQKNIFDPVDLDRMDEATLMGDEIPDINALAKPDVIGNLVKQYNATLEEYIEYRRAARKMAQFERLWDWHAATRGGYTQGSARKVDDKENDAKQYQVFVEELTRAAWHTVFRLTNMKGKMTSSIQEQFEENRNKVGSMAFNESNIYTVLELLIQNTNRMMTDCVLEVFDYFTKFHEDNRVYHEGWKTNDIFEVGPKVVLPGIMTREYGKPQINYSRRENTADIDKAMCFLSGKQYGSVKTIYQAVNEHAENIASDLQVGYSDKFESEFFTCKIFKKGTIHLVFKDKKLLSRFNQLVAKERGWLKAWQQKNAKKTDLIAA